MFQAMPKPTQGVKETTSKDTARTTTVESNRPLCCEGIDCMYYYIVYIVVVPTPTVARPVSNSPNHTPHCRLPAPLCKCVSTDHHGAQVGGLVVALMRRTRARERTNDASWQPENARSRVHVMLYIHILCYVYIYTNICICISGEN